jgi:hypothetical protein
VSIVGLPFFSESHFGWRWKLHRAFMSWSDASHKSSVTFDPNKPPRSTDVQPNSQLEFGFEYVTGTRTVLISWISNWWSHDLVTPIRCPNIPKWFILASRRPKPSPFWIATDERYACPPAHRFTARQRGAVPRRLQRLKTREGSVFDEYDAEELLERSVNKHIVEYDLKWIRWRSQVGATAYTIDVQTKKSLRVERRHWPHSIGLHSLFQKTSMFTPKKRTVKPGDAFENTAL